MAQAHQRAMQTQQRILSAAGTAFADRGFHATTTRDIAAAAGLSPAAVYVHHESKEQLLYLISLEGHQRTEELVREAVGSSEDPTEQLRAVMTAFAVFQVDQHVVARVINYERGALSDPHGAQITHLRRTIHRHVQEVVERGVARGDFDTASAEMATMAILSLGIDIARWYGQDATWPAGRIARFYADAALRIVGSR